MRKLDPRAEKTAANASHADKFSRGRIKSVRRKLRHARTVERRTDWLVAMGIDPSKSEAPVA